MAFLTPSLSRGNPPPLSAGQILGSAVIQHPSGVAGSILVGPTSSSEVASTGTNQTNMYLMMDGEPQQPAPVKSERSTPSSSGSKKGTVLVIQPQNEEEVDDNPEEDEVNPIPNCVEGGNNSPKEAVAAEDASGFPMKGMQKLRWKQYEKDNLQAKLVRGQILGLPEGQLPTRAQIDASDIFAIHPPQPQEDKEERAKVDMIDVHSYWLPYLHEQEVLGDCSPKEFQPPAGWPKLYTTEGLQDHVPEAVTKWGKDPLPSLIALINHQMALIPKHHLLSCLYNMVHRPIHGAAIRIHILHI